MKEMLKESYKVSNLYVLNGAKRKVFKGEGYNITRPVVWDIEQELSDEAKLEIIDFHTDGMGTYLINLISDYQVVRGNEEIIKRNSWGDLNKGSLKKWLRVADPKDVCSREILIHSYPTYHFLGQEYRLTLDCPTTDFGYKMLYDGKPVVRQWFHDLLIKLYKDENEWFVCNDPREIKITTVKDLLKEVGTSNINNKKLSDLCWNNNREGFTDEELDKYIEVLQDIVNYTLEKKALLSEEVEVCQK